MSADKKLAAAKAAIEYLPQAGVIGLGSGSTAKLFIDLVGDLVRSGRKLTGVATSQDSRDQAEALGIPLLSDSGPWQVDVCVDGADEVSRELDVIKGGGGCQTREKIINFASRFNIIIVDDSKLSEKLGMKWPVPVEVLSFAHATTRAHLERLGSVKLRLRNGAPWMTDAGNFIYDVSLGVIADPAATDQRLRALPGVVETGLFIQRANVVLVAAAEGIRKLTPSAP
ncbi:MAG TPA: ribose-5-phosphate isomerase RpiA [Polyangiaceae bacterium]|jgi:ribose 5-phosphate isomerase A|nr:ribose-5-phosphate isomerase RpiA [Polyangiaceae bacterium]